MHIITAHPLLGLLLPLHREPCQSASISAPLLPLFDSFHTSILSLDNLTESFRITRKADHSPNQIASCETSIHPFPFFSPLGQHMTTTASSEPVEKTRTDVNLLDCFLSLHLGILLNYFHRIVSHSVPVSWRVRTYTTARSDRVFTTREEIVVNH